MGVRRCAFERQAFWRMLGEVVQRASHFRISKISWSPFRK